MKKLWIMFLAVVLAVALVLPMAMPVAAAEAADLVGHWQFDGDALDRSGSGNHGTAYGATYVGSPMGQALSFVGSNDYVEVGDAPEFRFGDGDSITIEAWVQPAAATPLGVIVQKGGITDHDTNYALRQAGNQVDFFYYGDDAQWHGFRTDANVLTPLVMSHVAVTYTFGTPASIKIYVNGTSYAVSPHWPGTDDPMENDQTLRFGGLNYWSKKYYGLIDEVRIWNKALSEAELMDVDAPVVTITSPEDGAYYLVGHVPEGDSTVSDANGYTEEESGWSNDGGEHTYTVTATDCLGNVGEASVTYYVIDNDYGTIGGQIIQEDGGKKKDYAKISYGGWAGLYGDTEAGELEVTFHNVNNDPLDKTKFVSTSITSVTFYDTGWTPPLDETPYPPYSDHNRIQIVATGDLVKASNGDLIQAGCTITIQAVDTGEPGHPETAGFADSIRITIGGPGDTYDYDSSRHFGGDFEWGDTTDDASGYRHYIDAGNIQVVKVD